MLLFFIVNIQNERLKMALYEQTAIRNVESVLSTNRVLRQTYFLLSGTLLFSGLTAYWAMVNHARPIGPFLFIIGYFGLFFLTNALRNSKAGLVAIFALTGFMGYTLGPILSAYLAMFSNGNQLVMTALGGTGAIFLALSLYAVISQKDFSYLGGFIFAGILVVFLMSIVSIFFNTPAFTTLVSGAFALISSGLILFQTSQIINGGERNPIMATITLYIAIFNLFISLLQILGAFAGKRN
jgi:modulator of FtsH protease